VETPTGDAPRRTSTSVGRVRRIPVVCRQPASQPASCMSVRVQTFRIGHPFWTLWRPLARRHWTAAATAPYAVPGTYISRNLLRLLNLLSLLGRGRADGRFRPSVQENPHLFGAPNPKAPPPPPHDRKNSVICTNGCPAASGVCVANERIPVHVCRSRGMLTLLRTKKQFADSKVSVKLLYTCAAKTCKKYVAG